jgi:hypothetical protein
MRWRALGAENAETQNDSGPPVVYTTCGARRTETTPFQLFPPTPTLPAMSSLDSQQHPGSHAMTLSEQRLESLDLRTTDTPPPKRGLAFWLVFLALGVSTALNALEIVRASVVFIIFRADRSQSAIATALPTIIHDLGGGSTFIWVGSAYALCATAFVPLSGNLAEVISVVCSQHLDTNTLAARFSGGDPSCSVLFSSWRREVPCVEWPRACLS